MSDQKTILFAGGGTGGHLFPGISVAEALHKLEPKIMPLFLCTQREIDRVILEPTGFEFATQPIVPPQKTVSGLLKFWKGWRETKDLVKSILKARKPSAVLGLGGYAAGVGVKISAEKKIPTAILNPDVIPGKANQFLMKHAKAVCCQFAATSDHVPAEYRDKLQITGCPVRQEILNRPTRETAAVKLGLDPMLRTLVVTGASQGAQTVNEAVLEMLKGMTTSGWQILHLAGREHADAVRAGFRELENVVARVIDFTPAMSDVWAAADLAISRSGASSCAELTTCGVPSILLPYPFHKDMHQRANAKVLADAGAAVLVDDVKDRRKNAETLRPIVESLIHDLPKRTAMAAAADKLGRPNAAEAVAKVILEMIGN